MSMRRAGVAGSARDCPHCRARILSSAPTCPACRGHLNHGGAGSAASPRSVPLHVEASLQCDAGGPLLEYTMLLSVRDERGVELERHVVGVGAVRPDQKRYFTVTVEAAEADAS